MKRSMHRFAFFCGFTLLAGCSGQPGAESTAQSSQDLVKFCPSCARPGLITLASGLSTPTTVAVDALNVYWGDSNGDVMSIPTGGGTPTTLATGQGKILGLAAYYDSLSPAIVLPSSARPDFTLSASSLVFWAGAAVERVEVLPNVGTPFDVASAQNDPFSVAVDWLNVYWTDYANGSGNGAVMMAPVRGGPPVTLSSGGIPVGIAVDATNVYWTDETCCVMKKPLAGGQAVTLASGQNDPAGSLALDSIPVAGGNAANVYWTDLESGLVMTVPVSGGTPVTLASGVGWPTGVAVDSTAVYWADGTGGTINELRFGEDVPTVLASNQEGPYAIAVDSTSVYWTNFYGDTLMRVAK